MGAILPGDTDIYAITDSRLSRGRSLEEVASALLRAGIKLIQYREKKASPRQMLEECRLLRNLAWDYGASFVVNDHIDLALLCRADGVHIGQDDLPLREARKLVRPGMFIGLSTHSPEQAEKAVADGADYIGVGPIFPTQTKEDVVAPVGFKYLDWAAQNLKLPFVAIGGIKASNINEVRKHGARCCALVSELVGAEDISAKVREVRREMWRK